VQKVQADKLPGKKHTPPSEVEARNASPLRGKGVCVEAKKTGKSGPGQEQYNSYILQFIT